MAIFIKGNFPESKTIQICDNCLEEISNMDLSFIILDICTECSNNSNIERNSVKRLKWYSKRFKLEKEGYQLVV